MTNKRLTGKDRSKNDGFYPRQHNLAFSL